MILGDLLRTEIVFTNNGGAELSYINSRVGKR